MEENMSNLTCASGEASTVSSINGGAIYPPPHTVKKKRNQPVGPDAEVIALSPRTLMATNRFICEVCNKGFKRDQNLQLHRRGHNLPWKLKKRSINEANAVVKRKVYVCPETSCVNHDPSRALGDLTGIKKHFYRKHGEKKWKCERCSKKYAVQSDWKAHSKTCGSREYTCSCGTLFSRRDSFITHRAFCDALAEENAKSTLFHQTSPKSQIESQLPIKKEQESLIAPTSDLIPPWLGFPPMIWAGTSSSLFQDQQNQEQNPNPNPNPSSITMGPTTTLPPYTHPPPPPHISATALLQKATQMGSKCSNQGDHVTAGDFSGFGLNLSSRDHEFINGLASYGNKAASLISHSSSSTVPGASPGGKSNMMMINNVYYSSNGFDQGSRFEETAFGGGDEGNFLGQFGSSRNDDDHYLTRDFLGLRPLSQSDILSMTGLGNCINTSDASCNNEKSWQG